MIQQNIFDAQQFVATVDLAGVPTHSPKYLGPKPPGFIPRADEDQSVVVGSQLFAFAKGIDEGTRRALQNSALLAQLAASKRASPDDYEAWYWTYFEVLSSVGWLIQERDFNSFDSGSAQADVHEAVLQLAAGLMGGTATTAFQIVAATIGALQKLGEGNPAITVFRRETQRQQAARFQVSLAQKESDGGLLVSLMAFRLRASTTVTQALFFTFKSEEARLEHFSARLGINEDVLEAIAGAIAEKVTEHVDGYVRTLKI